MSGTSGVMLDPGGGGAAPRDPAAEAGAFDAALAGTGAATIDRRPEGPAGGLTQTPQPPTTPPTVVPTMTPAVEAAVAETTSLTGYPMNHMTIGVQVNNHLAALPTEGERLAYLQALVAHNAQLPGYIPGGLAFAAAEFGLTEQIGEMLGQLHSGGHLSTEQVAALFQPGAASKLGAALDLHATLLDMLGASGDAGLMGGVAEALFARIPNAQAEGDLFFTNPAVVEEGLASAAMALARQALDAGDPGAARRIFGSLWSDPGLRAMVVSRLAEAPDRAGLNDLLALMNGIDAGGDPAMEDLTETVFQEVLRNAGSFRGDAEILGALGTYFDNNIDRLIAEAALPRTENGAGGIAALNETDDDRLLSLFIENVLFDSGYAGRAASMTALSDRIEGLLDIINDPDASADARLPAAQQLGMVLGSIERAVADAEARIATDAAGVAGFLKDTSTFLFSFLNANKLPVVGRYLNQFRDKTVTAIENGLQNDPRSQIAAVLQALDQTVAAYQATLPGLEAGGAAAITLDGAFTTGRDRARDAERPLGG